MFVMGNLLLKRNDIEDAKNSSLNGKIYLMYSEMFFLMQKLVNSESKVFLTYKNISL